MKIIFLFIASIFFLTSCTTGNNSTNNNSYKSVVLDYFKKSSYEKIDVAIEEISNQLLQNISAKRKKKNKFVITTFVNLNDFKQTSKFARVISETLINEMHTRNFNIIDFRTQEAISVDQNGEFVLTRDVQKIKDEITESFILVGTYSVINKNKTIINARILNNFTSEVISTAKVIYKYENCKDLDICEKKEKTSKFSIIKITEDKEEKNEKNTKK